MENGQGDLGLVFVGMNSEITGGVEAENEKKGEIQEEAVKKKRGRPPKNPKITEEMKEEGVAAAAGKEKRKKKKRGRPKKITCPVQGENKGEEIKEMKEEGDVAQKRRGRPKKNKDLGTEDITLVKEQKIGEGSVGKGKRGRPKKSRDGDEEKKKRPRMEKDENGSCGEKGLGQSSNLEGIEEELKIVGAAGEGKAGAEAVVSEGKKKKRGRPKKLQDKKEENGSTSSCGERGIKGKLEANVSVGEMEQGSPGEGKIAAEVAVTEGKKKKRGRPKKMKDVAEKQQEKEENGSSLGAINRIPGVGVVQEDIEVARDMPTKEVMKEENDADVDFGPCSDPEGEEQHVEKAKRRRKASKEVNLDGDEEKKKPGRKPATKPASEEQVETAQGQNGTRRSMRERLQKTQEPPSEAKPKPKSTPRDENV